MKVSTWVSPIIQNQTWAFNPGGGEGSWARAAVGSGWVGGGGGDCRSRVRVSLSLGETLACRGRAVGSGGGEGRRRGRRRQKMPHARGRRWGRCARKRRLCGWPNARTAVPVR